MKICIPTIDDSGLESKPFDHFGSAPFFTVVDAESGEFKVVPGAGCHEQHDSRHHVPLLRAHHVDAVVCNGVGRRAFDALHAAGIDVMIPAQGTVADIVRAVREGQADELLEEQVCGGGRCRNRHGGRRYHRGWVRGRGGARAGPVAARRTARR